MSKFIGRGATVKTHKKNCINTSGMSCVVEEWDKSIGKYKVDFGNGFCGWYKRSELEFDSE